MRYSLRPCMTKDCKAIATYSLITQKALCPKCKKMLDQIEKNLCKVKSA